MFSRFASSRVSPPNPTSAKNCTAPSTISRSRSARGNRGVSVCVFLRGVVTRSEEHTSELQSLMRISYAVFCLQKKNNYPHAITSRHRHSHRNQSTFYHPASYHRHD